LPWRSWPPTDSPRLGFGQLPFKAEQVFEEVVAPLGRRLGPGDFQAAGDRVAAFALAKFVLPAEALLVETCQFRIDPDVGRRGRPVRLTEGMAADD
jgi:hypothetical protein